MARTGGVLSRMDMDMGSSNATECKISMLWNWYTVDACFLSSDWRITSTGSFAATCIGVVLMVVLLEALRRLGREFDDWILKDFQRRALARSAAYGALSASTKAKETFPRCGGILSDAGYRESTAQEHILFRASPLQQLIRAVLYAVTFGLAYIIMLLAMYFNGYVIICIILGAGLGKFFCDWLTKTLTLDANMYGQAEGIVEPTVCCS